MHLTKTKELPMQDLGKNNSDENLATIETKLHIETGLYAYNYIKTTQMDRIITHITK